MPIVVLACGKNTRFDVSLNGGPSQSVPVKDWTVNEDFEQPVDDVNGEAASREGAKIINFYRCRFVCENDGAGNALRRLLQRAKDGGDPDRVLFKAPGGAFEMRGFQLVEGFGADVPFVAQYHEPR